MGPARNEKKMAGSFFEQRKSPTKVRTSVGLGVDLVDQLGHGGLPIGHGGDGLLRMVDCWGIRTDNVGRPERRFKMSSKRSSKGKGGRSGRENF